MGTGRKTNTIVVIAVRSQSSRLPDKFKANICGKPMMVRIVETVSAAMIDKVVIANVIGDQPVIDLCREYGIEYADGEEKDILGRIYWAVKQYNPRLVVRVWGDSPLIKPKEIDFAIDYFRLKKPPYLSVFTSDGVVAVMTFKELERLFMNLNNSNDREWLHKYQAGLAGAINLDFGTPITVDTLEDLEKVRKIASQRN